MNLDLKISRKELQELRQSDIDGDEFLHTLLKRLIFDEMTSSPFTIIYYPARYRDEETVSANLKIIVDSKADWLRSEIEKFEVTQREHFCTLENGNDYDHGAWDVYDSIITRYKEELKVLESKFDDWNEDMGRNEELMNDSKEELKVLK